LRVNQGDEIKCTYANVAPQIRCLVQILPYCLETDYSFCEDSPPAGLPQSEPLFKPVLQIVNLDFKGVAWIVITNEFAIGCMSLRTTVQTLEVRRPDTGVRSQLAQFTLPDMDQDRWTDGQTAALLIAPRVGA